MPLESTELAYAAGIIDGEGCIRVNKQGTRRHVVRVHVTNTDLRLVNWLRERFGGYIWTEDGHYMPNAKIRHVWEVSALKAAAFLEIVYPYLMLKKEQAEIALALQATKQRRGPTPVPVEVLAERERLAMRLTLLNKKGVA